MKAWLLFLVGICIGAALAFKFLSRYSISKMGSCDVSMDMHAYMREIVQSLPIGALLRVATDVPGVDVPSYAIEGRRVTLAVLKGDEWTCETHRVQAVLTFDGFVHVCIIPYDSIECIRTIKNGRRYDTSSLSDMKDLLFDIKMEAPKKQLRVIQGGKC